MQQVLYQLGKVVNVDANKYVMGRVTFFTVIWIIITALIGLGMVALFDVKDPLVALTIFVAGCLGSVVAYRLILNLIGRFNFLPICRNKHCSARKYIFERQSEEGVYYRCRCGDLYLVTANDQFEFVTPDGTRQPYRCRYEPYGQWWPAPELFEKYRKP